MTTPSKQKIPKGAPRPREAVLKMAPYSPPTGGRAGKLRLDFNENTIGSSPRIIDFLKQLKQDTTLRFIPVILVTAKADTDDVVKGLRHNGLQGLTSTLSGRQRRSAAVMEWTPPAT